MKNSLPLIIIVTLGAAITPTVATAQQDGMDKFQLPLPAVKAGEWWKTSWQGQYRYQADAEFVLSCDTKLASGPDPKWIDSMIHGQLAAKVSLELTGISHVSTFAVEGSPDPLLLRYYDSVHVDRKLGGSYESKPGSTSNMMHNWLFKGAGISRVISKAVDWMAAFAMALYSDVPVSVEEVEASGLGTVVGVAAQAVMTNQLKEAGVTVTDGGFEIKPGSKTFNGLPFASQLTDISNLAVQLTEDFRNRVLIIDAHEGWLLLRDASSSAQSLSHYVGDRAEFRKLVAGLPEPTSDRVRAVLQRETLAMNEQIFNGRTRKVRECWVVDGSILSSILHPDLKGHFRGQIVLRYEKDILAKKSGHYADVEQYYTAQVLTIVPTATIDGQTVLSDLSYEEPRFHAKINDSTGATLYIDQQNSLIREADLDFVADATNQLLPDMVITSGLQAEGKARLAIRYFATRKKISLPQY